MTRAWRGPWRGLRPGINSSFLGAPPGAEGRSREAFIAAREALDVYAPLAHRLGMYQLKNELENLGFKHLYPQQHQLITEQLADRAEKHEVLLSEQLLLVKSQ